MARTNLKYYIGANISEAEKKFKNLGSIISRTGKKFSDFGKAASVAVSGPLVALGGLSAKVALQVDAALDDIRIGTGTTGEALKGLEDDFRSVAAAVPQSFGESAKAIADFNTLTGASGKELQALSVAALDASRMMKTDLGGTISSVGKLMNNWRLPIGRGVELMDKLFVASQSTGMAMDAIAASATSSGAALRRMGFGIDESLALISKLDKEGIQADQVLKSLNKALATMAQKGVTNTSQAFASIVDSIKNAKTHSEATARAMQVFGTRAGPELAAAIREGRFEINDLVTALGTARGAISDTSKDTDGFAQQWSRLTNQLGLALEPLGKKILGLAEEHMPALSKAIEEYTLDIDEGTIKMLAFTAAVGPATLALGAFAGSIGALVKATGALSAALLGTPLGWAIMGFGAFAVTVETVGKWLDGTGKKATKTKDEILALARATEIATERINKSISEDPNNIWNLSFGTGQAYEHAVTPEDLAQAEKELAKEKKLREDIAKVEEQERKKLESQTAKLPSSLRTPAVNSSVGMYNFSSGKSGPSAAERFVDNIRDRMRYLKEDGQGFLDRIEKMQGRLKPLSSDWKLLEDLKISIDTEGFDKSLQDIQDRIRYLDKDGAEFVPTLQKMLDGLDPLSEKGKRTADVLRSITEADYSKKWSGFAWEFSEGLMKADEYARLLQTEIAGLAEGTEKWRARFSELQNIKASEVGGLLDSLARQFESGKLQSTEYETALEGIIRKFDDFPRAAQMAADALEAFRMQNEMTTVSLGTQLTGALRDVTKDFNELQGKSILGVVDGFLQAAVRGDDFGQTLRRLGEDIVYTTLKMVILQQLTRMLGGAFGIGGGGASFIGGSFASAGMPGLGGFAFANGGVFHKFALGGVVSRPTVFPMANGMGLMGEKGDEAVMPLARDPQGRLGVRMSGGTGAAPSIVVNVENQTATPIRSEQTSVDFNEQFNQAVVGIILKDQATNGPITRNFRR